MSVKKPPPSPDNIKPVEVGEDYSSSTTKRRRPDRCLPFMEISIEPGKSLKEIDSKTFKDEIKRWAKSVVKYARQLSGRLGSSRKSGRIGSSGHGSSSEGSS